MIRRRLILLIAALAVALNGLAPLAVADGGRDDSSRQSPCQVMPATPSTTGVAIGAETFELAAWPAAAIDVVRSTSFAPPERSATPRLPRTLLAQHILLRI